MTTSGHPPFPAGPPPSPHDGRPAAQPAGPPTGQPVAGPPPYTPATPYGEGSGPSAPPTVPPGTRGLSYHLLLRGGWPGTWWRALVGIAVLGIGGMLLAPFLLMAGFAAWFAATGAEVGPAMNRMLDLETLTPAGLVFLNLSLAALIPVVWLVVRYLHGLRPRWTSSVAPRIRWGYLAACFGLALVALIATVLVASVVPSGGTGAEMSGEANAFTDTVRDFLLVIVLLTPLQAAAEEYAFRGYLLQSFGGILDQLGRGRMRWLGHPAFTVALTSVIFALAHGGQDPPIFFDRFAFGVVAGTLVILTGGLEAGIAMHVLNNWFAFGGALAYGDMSTVLSPTGGSWWSLPVTLTQSLVYLALAWGVARKMGLSQRSDPAVLAAPESRV